MLNILRKFEFIELFPLCNHRFLFKLLKFVQYTYLLTQATSRLILLPVGGGSLTAPLGIKIGISNKIK